MKITNVEAILLKGDAAYGARAGSAEASDSGDYQVLVHVATDDGLVGYSDVETLATAAVPIVAGPGMQVLGFRALKDVILGKQLGKDFGKSFDDDLAGAQQLWDDMYI